MFTKMMGLLGCLIIALLTPGLAHSEGKEFTVAGEVRFTNAGNIFIRLITEQEFRTRKMEKNTPFALILEVSSEEMKHQKVAFIFHQVPPGTYSIGCYQDMNGNQKFDTRIFGIPKEPWGLYRLTRPVFRKPKFEEVAFEVKEDITNIQLEVR
jgi:uncharacterized protein (DUF2141 family)